MAASKPLTTQALNRALLDRQMLLRRENITPVRAIERLAGLQAQQPRPPFIGLWARVAGFKREALVRLLENRKVVRATMMRATLHLVSAKDYLAFRGAIQPALMAAMQSIVQRRTAGLDVEAVVAAADRCFRERPQTFAEARAALATRFPDFDERAMGYAARTCLPLVMVPDGAEHGFGPVAKFVAAGSWLGEAVQGPDRVQDLLLRYLAAFGPATAADAQT